MPGSVSCVYNPAMWFLRLKGVALLPLAFLACGEGGTEWLSEQDPYEPGVTVRPVHQPAPMSPHDVFTSVSVGMAGVCGVRQDGSIYCRERPRIH